MPKKTIIFFIFLASIANSIVFSQTVTIDTAISNAARAISQSVPNGTRVAVLDISSDFKRLSDYIIDELTINLVNAGTLHVLPRTTVEAETIITGTFTRETTADYRLVVNATDLESSAVQFSYRASIHDDRQLRALIAEDYTVGERLGIGALNIFGGAGSISRGARTGWLVTGIQGVGLLSVLGGVIYGIVQVPSETEVLQGDGLPQGGLGPMPPDSGGNTSDEQYYKLRRGLITAGSVVIGTGVVVGFIIPFFHQRAENARAEQNNFPLILEPVSSNGQDINGFSIAYSIRF
jgi:hypothetical protein